MGSTAMAMVVSGTVFSLTQSSFPVATTRQLICHKPAASLLNCRAELSSQGDSDRRRTEPGSWSRKSPSSPGLLPPEDVGYIMKLTLGSLVGAAVIKYGSVLLPGITTPNVVEAFLIVGLSVTIAVVLLMAASFQLDP